MAKERVSLYFNTDIPVEKAMWDFISKDGRKSQKIKRVIEDAMNESKFVVTNEVKKEVVKNDIDKSNEEDLDADELDGVDL